jgi:uncharacterized ParB-like nuclease family protein
MGQAQEVDLPVVTRPVAALAAGARAQAAMADMPSVTLPADFATACAAAATGVCPPNGDGVQVTVAYFADPSLLVQATPSTMCE